MKQFKKEDEIFTAQKLAVQELLKNSILSIKDKMEFAKEFDIEIPKSEFQYQNYFNSAIIRDKGKFLIVHVRNEKFILTKDLKHITIPMNCNAFKLKALKKFLNS